MRSRVLASFILSCVLAAAVAAAAASSEQRSTTIPACEELLTLKEAELSMGEPLGGIIGRTVVGSTRGCSYVGGKKGSKLGHGLGVLYGPYLDSRRMAPEFAKKYICPISKEACKKFMTAATLRPDRKSFAALELALGQVGTTRRQPRGLDNPAFLWKPSISAASLDESAFVVVYVTKTADLIEVTCTDLASKRADVPCAIRGAIRVESAVE